MFSWITSTAQSTLSAVAGTAEPIYGPEAIQSVSVQEAENPTYEVTLDDLKWQALEATSVETQTFYVEAANGYFIIIQAVYSNVSNLHLTTQFNVKVFYPDGKIVWSAATLVDHVFSENMRDFYAENFSLSLSEDGKEFTIKSVADADVMVDVKITNVAPGFKIGKDGMTKFGTDHANPWGTMRHIFWPRAKAEGVVIVKEEKVECAGKAVMIMALQGMKPHHAAARWNFIAFHGEKYSAIMMEFTTPPSYGTTTVNVCGIVTDDKLITASTKGTFEHLKSKHDEETGWEEPTEIRAAMRGKTLDGKDVEAVSDITLEPRIDRVDIMVQVPVIIKRVLAGTVGTAPYIYQYRQKTALDIKIGDEVIAEKGQMFSEATFIV